MDIFLSQISLTCVLRVLLSLHHGVQIKKTFCLFLALILCVTFLSPWRALAHPKIDFLQISKSARMLCHKIVAQPHLAPAHSLWQAAPDLELVSGSSVQVLALTVLTLRPPLSMVGIALLQRR